MKGFLKSFAVFESLKVRLVKVASIAKNLIVRRLKKSYTCFEVSSQEKNDEFLSTPALFWWKFFHYRFETPEFVTLLWKSCHEKEILYESLLSQRFGLNASAMVCINEISSNSRFCQNVRVQKKPESTLKSVSENEKMNLLKYHVIPRQIFQSTDFIQRWVFFLIFDELFKILFCKMVSKSLEEDFWVAFKSDYNSQTDAWFGCLDLPLQVSTLLPKYKPTDYKLNQEPRWTPWVKIKKNVPFQAKYKIKLFYR